MTTINLDASATLQELRVFARVAKITIPPDKKKRADVLAFLQAAVPGAAGVQPPPPQPGSGQQQQGQPTDSALSQVVDLLKDHKNPDSEARKKVRAISKDYIGTQALPFLGAGLWDAVFPKPGMAILPRSIAMGERIARMVKEEPEKVPALLDELHTAGKGTVPASCASSTVARVSTYAFVKELLLSFLSDVYGQSPATIAAALDESEEAVTRLLLKEQVKRLNKDEHEASHTSKKHRSGGGGSGDRCWHCRSDNHDGNHCPTVTCSACQTKGHCWKVCKNQEKKEAYMKAEKKGRYRLNK